MDKKVILKMLPTRDIVISVEGGRSITIAKDNRSINANEIYNLLDFSRGDKITVESENEAEIDTPVLDFFKELITDIAQKLNKIAEYDEDEYLVDMESS